MKTNQPTTEIVVGGQFGSEAKGHVCEILANTYQDDRACNIRVGGPNAGHTVYDENGDRFPFRHLPVAAVLNRSALYIGPGSEIDPRVLADEVEMAESYGHPIRGRLYISPTATVIQPEHIAQEQQHRLRERVGSTAKGIGAARADRLWRNAPTVADRPEEFLAMGAWISDAPAESFGEVAQSYLIEGTQGYGLGLHAGFYPYCTAGDCRNVDFLAQSGLSLTSNHRTWVVFRTHPIRVAGNSGPLWMEQDWDDLARASGDYIQPEHTTVTKLQRRVGLWDPELARQALQANGGPDDSRVMPVLSFVDYLDPALAGSYSWTDLQDSPAWPRIEEMQHDIGAEFELFTTGPISHIWKARA